MKPATALARLTKVELREVFATEPGDFTPWLAQEENLALLGDTVDIDLQFEAQEKDVGPYRADILCKDTASDNWVLIENQIEKTDHTHLGQLLTYAAGLDAVTIIWVAQQITDQHRAALDWLNEHTDEHINLFGLEIELWRINDSPVAPKFNIVCQPNNWSRVIRNAAGAGEVSDREKAMLEFWTAYAEYVGNNSPAKIRKPAPKRSMRFSLGKNAIFVAAILSTWNSVANTSDPEIRVELRFNNATAREDFVSLEPRKAEIEAAIGKPLTWHTSPNINRCRVYTTFTTDFQKKELWAQQHRWLKETVEVFTRVFKPIVQTLDDNAATATAGGQ